MLIFINTELTDFANAELISVGMVTDDAGHEFFAELPVTRKKCNDFVRVPVLPRLGTARRRPPTA